MESFRKKVEHNLQESNISAVWNGVIIITGQKTGNSVEVGDSEEAE